LYTLAAGPESGIDRADRIAAALAALRAQPEVLFAEQIPDDPPAARPRADAMAP
jgi:hypothetical protein